MCNTVYLVLGFLYAKNGNSCCMLYTFLQRMHTSCSQQGVPCNNLRPLFAGGYMYCTSAPQDRSAGCQNSPPCNPAHLMMVGFLQKFNLAAVEQTC